MGFYPKNPLNDLREEFHALLWGDALSAGIGRPVLIRLFSNVKCFCFDSPTGSPSDRCAYCLGEGYQFEERLVPKVYFAKNFGSVQNPAAVIQQQQFLSQYGFTDMNRALAFCEWDALPGYERWSAPSTARYDVMYELKVTDSGALEYPVKKLAKWKIRSCVPHHGDGGRVEFFEMGLEKETV